MSSNDALLSQYATIDSLATRRDLYQYATGASLTEEIFSRLNGFPGMSFLDVGCGYGADVATLLEKFPDTHAVGIDQSAGMINDARQRAPGATFLVDDAKTFTLDERFNRILVRHALHLVDDPQQAIQNILQHLAPNGRAIFVTHSLSSLPNFNNWREWFEVTAGISYRSPGDAFTVENDAARFDGDSRTVTAEKLTSIIRLTNAEPILSYIRSQKRWSRPLTDDALEMLLNHAREEVTNAIATHGSFEEQSVNGIITVTRE
ncbi:MAG: class I SAM-dependent methyltransferase [Patescibacteria group bacterium]